MRRVLVLIAALGLLAGSFLNTVIENTVIEHVSRGTSLAPARLDWLRPQRWGPGDVAVIVATAALFIAVALRLDALGSLSALPAYLYFTAIGVALTVIDIRLRRLPNRIVLPSYPVLAVLLALATAVHDDWWALARAGLGGAALLGFYFVLAFAHPAGMGWGDVKLSGVIGVALSYLSWAALAVGAFAGFLLGALWGVVLISTRRAGRKSTIPFGPFVVAGAFVAIFATEAVVRFFVDTMLG